MKYSTIPQFAEAWCFESMDMKTMPDWLVKAFVQGDLATEKMIAVNKAVHLICLSGDNEPLNGVADIEEGNFDWVVRMWDGEIVLMRSREFRKFFAPVMEA